ncbi:MAG: DUF2231 domain-containing protein [bacterium]
MEFFAGLHPKIVHFPIALFVIYTFMEIFGVLFKKDAYTKSAHLILSFGILSAVAAVLTGNQAYETAKLIFGLQQKFPNEIIALHEQFATVTLWYFLLLFIFRTYIVMKKKLTKTFLIIFSVLGLIGCYFLYLTGNYGAELVYKYGIGIKILQ